MAPAPRRRRPGRGRRPLGEADYDVPPSFVARPTSGTPGRRRHGAPVRPQPIADKIERISVRPTTRLVAHGEPPRWFTFSGLAALGLPHVTTTRHFPGVTAPSQPTAPFNDDARGALRAAGLDLARVAYARQVHGADVLRAPVGGGWAGAGDILTTTERRVPLAIFTADCLAVTLWDSIAHVLVVAHVGWRGTARARPAPPCARRSRRGRAPALHAASRRRSGRAATRSTSP